MQRDLWRDHEIVAQLRPAKLQTSTPSARSSSRVTMNSNHDSNIRRVSSLGSKWYHLAHGKYFFSGIFVTLKRTPSYPGISNN